MLRRHVERFEVVVIVLELGPFGDEEAEAEEDLLDAVAEQRQGMAMADERRPAGKRDVDPVRGRTRRGGVGEARLQRVFDVLLEEVRVAPERGPPVRRRLRDVFQEGGGEAAFAGEIAISQRAQFGFARRGGEFTLELRSESRNLQRRSC